MAISKWVHRLSDGMFLHGGFCDPEFDPAKEGVVEFPDSAPHPDRRLWRANVAGACNFNPSEGPNKLVAATPGEIEAFDTTDPHQRREAARHRLSVWTGSSPPSGKDFEDLLIYLGLF